MWVGVVMGVVVGIGLYGSMFFLPQLGGSVGIAGMTTLLSRYTEQTSQLLRPEVTATSPVTLDRLAALGRGLMARGVDPYTAKQQAFALLDRQILQQAGVIAYGRIYLLSGVALLAALPLLLVRDTPRGAGGVVHAE